MATCDVSRIVQKIDRYSKITSEKREVRWAQLLSLLSDEHPGDSRSQAPTRGVSAPTGLGSKPLSASEEWRASSAP